MLFKSISIAVINFLIVSATYGQYTISGSVQDLSGKSIEYSDILLMKKGDNALYKRGYSDSSGYFRLHVDGGEYVLQITMLKMVLFQDTLLVSQDIDLETIKIDVTRQLDGVDIIERRPLIERKIDRIVFHVENNPAYMGMNLLETMENVPMVMANDGGLSIVGKSNVGVMINGKILLLSGSELRNYLQSLRANDIASVEIITSPPSKYDAQGNSGLINVVLKRNPNLGFSGNYELSYIQRTYGGYTNNLTLNYQSTSFTASARLRQYDVQMAAEEHSDLIGNPSSILNSNVRKDFNNGLGANFSMNYKINNSSNIGLIYDVSLAKANQDVNGNGIFLTGLDVDSLLLTYSERRMPFDFHTGNLYYDLNLDTTGKQLSIIGNLLINSPNDNNRFWTNNQRTGTVHDVDNRSSMNYKIYSGQFDLVLPYRWARLEAGGKLTQILNGSSIEYYNVIDGSNVLDPNRSNVFDYDEMNYAAYLSGDKAIGKKFNIKAGLRYEHAYVDGFSETSNIRTRYDYGSWFPTAYLSYNASDQHVLTANYSKRINRPNFSALNPFRMYLNPNYYVTGEPFLRPSFSHNLELGYVMKGNLSITLYSHKVSNSYATYLLFDEDTRLTVSTLRNSYDELNLGANVSYFLNPISWYQTSLFGNVFHNRMDGLNEQFVDQEGTSFYYNINNTAFLNKKKSLMMTLTYYQFLSQRINNINLRSRASFSVGFAANMLANRLRLSMNMGDIFLQQWTRGEEYFPEFNRYFRNFYDSRRLLVSLNYSFGNNMVRGTRKNVAFEERGRAN